LQGYGMEPENIVAWVEEQISGSLPASQQVS
jgi:hypothetical protein